MKPCPVYLELDDPRGNGVFGLPAAGRSLLARQVAGHGLNESHLDLRGLRRKKDLLAAAARALAFPDWFGDNWDALLDCLVDLDWLPGPGQVIWLQADEGFGSRPRTNAATFLGILEEACRMRAEQDERLFVFVTCD